jgi:hypothetical protein
LILQNKLVKPLTRRCRIGYEILKNPLSAEEIVNKSVDSYELPEVKLFRIETNTPPN